MADWASRASNPFEQSDSREDTPSRENTARSSGRHKHRNKITPVWTDPAQLERSPRIDEQRPSDSKGAFIFDRCPIMYPERDTFDADPLVAYFNGLSRSLDAQIDLACHFLTAHTGALRQNTEGLFDFGTSSKAAEQAVSELAASVATFRSRVRSWSGNGSRPMHDAYPQQHGNGPASALQLVAARPRSWQALGNGEEESSPASPSASQVGGLSTPKLWSTWVKDEQGNGVVCRITFDNQIRTHKSKTPRGERVVHWPESDLEKALIAPPDSARQFIRDMLSSLAIVYDLFTLPLMFFNFRGGVFTVATSVYWACDIVAAFFMGYIDSEGAVELRLSVIASKYLHSWFLPDLVIVVVDLSMLLVTNVLASKVASLARMSKLMRMMRLKRMVRTFGGFRIENYFTSLKDSMLSDTLGQALGVAKLLGVIATICHFVGCFWYGIGTFEDEYGVHDSWVTQLKVDDDHMFYRYLVCFHWAFAQFTPAPISYHAQTLFEELFTLFVLFTGFVVFSSFIGSVSGKVTAIRLKSEQRDTQDTLLANFVRANGLSWKLAYKIATITRQRMHAMEPSQRRVVEKDVDLLRHAPETLLRELHSEVFTPTLEDHPLFSQLFSLHGRAMSDLCHDGVSQDYVVKECEVFPFGEEATEMIFVLNFPPGFLYYLPGPGFYHEEDRDPGQFAECNTFKGGSWLNEAALWIQFKHVGRLVAGTEVAVALVKSKALQKVVGNHLDAKKELSVYAQHFSEQAMKLGLMKFKDQQEFSAAESMDSLTLDTWPRPGEKICEDLESPVAPQATNASTSNGLLLPPVTKAPAPALSGASPRAPDTARSGVWSA